MYPGYWEDYMNDGSEEPDNIDNVYSVTLFGEEYTSLTTAYKTLHPESNTSHKNRKIKIIAIKRAGGTVKVREYNQSKKKWHTDSFITL